MAEASATERANFIPLRFRDDAPAAGFPDALGTL
jgi:hypothetical protein